MLLPLPLAPWMKMRSPLATARSGISRPAAVLSGPRGAKRADANDGLGGHRFTRKARDSRSSTWPLVACSRSRP